MLILKNSELTIDLIDPASDQIHLGPRFCWGGYIWQVKDNKLGPLMSGPEWPKAFPDPFNGQGLPESFRYKTRDNKFLTWNGSTGVSLGAGELGIKRRNLWSNKTLQMDNHRYEVWYKISNEAYPFGI